MLETYLTVHYRSQYQFTSRTKIRYKKKTQHRLSGLLQPLTSSVAFAKFNKAFPILYLTSRLVVVCPLSKVRYLKQNLSHKLQTSSASAPSSSLLLVMRDIIQSQHAPTRPLLQINDAQSASCHPKNGFLSALLLLVLFAFWDGRDILLRRESKLNSAFFAKSQMAKQCQCRYVVKKGL